MTIAGPGRSYSLEGPFDWLLIAGDESAIPAIATLLEAVPDTVRTQALIEVNDAADEFALAPPRPTIAVRWLHRAQPLGAHAPGARAGVELAAAVAAFALPAGTGASTWPARPTPCAASVGSCSSNAACRASG